jgi:hypothetical protein
MTRVRSKRSNHIHVTLDARRTLCSRPCDGWVIEFDTAATCPRCVKVAEGLDEDPSFN